MQSSNHEHFLNKNQTPSHPSHRCSQNALEQQEGEMVDIFSSQKSRMDYVTLEGIENRTGIEKKNVYAFVLKELLDNAVDFLETQHSGSIIQKERKAMAIIPAAAEVRVIILKEEDNKFLHIIVVNSNEYGKAVFSKSMLQSIFNFDIFYSSKRNQYRITRGALGDAFKEILCIPYALAREQQQDHSQCNEPLTIRIRIGNIQQTFQVHLVIDRINQIINSEIVEELKEKEKNNTQQQQSNFTEIEVCLPIVQDMLDLAKLKRFLVEYATFNTHMDFAFNLPAESAQTNQQQHNITLSFPQVQPINTKWTNTSSIYYYTLPEFQNFIFGLDNNNNDLPIYNVLQKTFREGSNMKRAGFAEMTVGQLKQNPQSINEFYIKLRNTMKPLSTPSNLSLPFDVNKKVRMEAFKKRIEQRASFFKIFDMKYKSKYGYCKFNDAGTEYPFFFEIAVVHSNSIEYNLDFIDSLNSSVMPGAYSFMIGSDTETFRWQTQSDRKNDSIHTSQSIFEIFEHYGYSYDKDKCKKPHSLIIANLISPRIDYKSYGKSSIDLAPFADVISEATFKACSGGPSSKISVTTNEVGGKPVSIIGILRKLLKERLEAVKQDPNLKERQKWTQSTVFYHLRPILLSYGYSNEKIDRQYITSEIKNVCETYLGVKREDIGITAADRAQLYFKGKWHDVGEKLSIWFNMPDMLIVEKEGVVKQLAPFADEKGIALLNTRGFLTEYASILSEQSSKNGCNIAILTDFDASGLLIASNIPNAYRIGVDFETLDYFDLDPSTVEEKSKPEPNHLKALKGLAGDYNDDLFDLFDLIHEEEEYADNPFEKAEVEYVSEKRIEIDSVMAAVNDNATIFPRCIMLLESFDGIYQKHVFYKADRIKNY